MKNKAISGFTLIELLVVIALLGALFVGILATIDPLEQLKKGTDTTRRNITTEIYNGMLQYYSVINSFPWTADINALAASDPSMTNAVTGYITKVVSAGELKTEFISLASSNLNRIFLTSTADSLGFRQNLSVCYLPDAKSFRMDANAKYGINGVISSGCAVTSPCYWCVK